MTTGRPTKLSPDVQKKLDQAITAGAPYDLACAYAGIGVRTFHRWMAKGENATRGEFWHFWRAIKDAEGRAMMRNLALIATAATTDWHAAAWLLERRYPHLFGKTVQQVDQHTTVSGEVSVNVFPQVRALLLEEVGDDPEKRARVAAKLMALYKATTPAEEEPEEAQDSAWRDISRRKANGHNGHASWN